MTTLVSFWLGGFLVVVAALKVWRSKQAATALVTYGISDARLQRVGVSSLVCSELALAGGLAAGASWAAGAIAGLFLLFAAATLAALLAGRKGRPCACFGSASRLGWSSPARASALAIVAGVLALGWLPSAPVGYDRWLTVGLSVSFAAAGALALAVFALAREVGVLRLGSSARGALEIPEEGPAVGTPQALAVAVEAGARAVLRLAIFTSEGCPLCAQVAPSVSHVAADPLLAVRIFDEAVDAAVWAQAGVPGSPYAIVLSLEGVALAKGTFNSLSQLESVVATGRFRERGLSVAA
jgi:hypothetical protein